MEAGAAHQGDDGVEAHTAPAPSGAGAPSTAGSPARAAPEDEEVQSRLRVATDAADLMAALAATRGQVEVLRRENRRLNDAGAALDALQQRAAYLGSLLARDAFQAVMVPSAQLGGTAADEAATGDFDCAWAGVLAPAPMFDALVTAPVALVAKLEFRSRAMGHQAMMEWSRAGGEAERATIQARVATYIQLREQGRRYVTAKHPEAMARIWRAVAPVELTHVALRQRRQALVAANLSLTQEQVTALRVAALELRAGVARMVAEGAAAAATHGTAAAAAEAAAETRTRAARHLLLYDRLMHAVVVALTWVQATYVGVAMAPYAPDYSELCHEMLTRAGAL